MRLIDADKHIAYLTEKRNVCADFDDVLNVMAYEIAIKEIKAADTIDAEPVVHAHWEDDGSGHDDMICSHCGEYLATDEDGWTFDELKNWSSEYCPWCGAKMFKEDKNAFNITINKAEILRTYRKR